jgi:hypothetical protein
LEYSFNEEFITQGETMEDMFWKNGLFWDAQKEQVKCFVCASPTLQVTRVFMPRAEVPIVHISYDLRELWKLSLFLGLMKRQKILPRIFLRNENTPRAEVLVVFEIVSMPHGQLAKLCGREEVKRWVKETSTARVFTTAASRVEGYALRRFLTNFSDCGEAIVAITERDGKSASSKPIDAVQYFEVTKLERKLPDLWMY